MSSWGIILQEDFIYFAASAKRKLIQGTVNIHGMREPSKCKEDPELYPLLHSKQILRFLQAMQKKTRCDGTWNSLEEQAPQILCTWILRNLFQICCNPYNTQQNAMGHEMFMERVTLQVFLLPPVPQFHNFHGIGFGTSVKMWRGVNFSLCTIKKSYMWVILWLSITFRLGFPILDICRGHRGHFPWRIFLSCGEILDVETF